MKQKDSDVTKETQPDVAVFSGKKLGKKYDEFYKVISKQDDETIFDWIRFFKKHRVTKNDIFDIGLQVCKDILFKKE